MKIALPFAASLCVWLTILGCADAVRESGGGNWIAEQDTIGDTVVVRTISGSVGLGKYVLERELTIGVLEGPEEYVLGNVSMLAVGPEGDIYAYDAQVPVLRKYDHEGRFITTIGREGGGPGEYQRATGLRVTPDGTVKLWDPRGPRLSSFSPEGEFLGGVRVESRGLSVSQSLFVDTLGNAYVFTSVSPPTPGPPGTAPGGLIWLGPDGEVRDTLFEPDLGYEVPLVQETVRRGTSVLIGTWRVPFTPPAYWTFSPHGYYVAGIGGRYAVSLFRVDEMVLRIERDIAPVPVHPEEAVAWREAIVASVRQVSTGWRWNGPDISDTKPAFRELEVGLDGRIWVRLHQQAERQEPVDSEEPDPERVWPEPTVYDMFEPDGRYLGAVSVPRETTIHVMRGDYVWGITRDSLDVQYIERFRLVAGTR
jgi:hypothetical protein